MYTCQYCQKNVKDLNQHLKRMAGKAGHPDIEPVTETSEPETEAPHLELENLPQNDGKRYHCVDCGASVSHKAPHCPGCGAELDWSGV